MKKLLILIISALAFTFIKGQGRLPNETFTGNLKTEAYDSGARGSFYGFHFRHNYSDTTDVNNTAPILKTIPGFVVLANDTLRKRNATATKWDIVGSGSGGGGIGTVTNVSALTLGTTGTDLSSSVANSGTTPVITLNVPTASAINRGALSASDWIRFNNKWGLTGNSGTTAGTNFIGTTDNVDLVFKTNAALSGRIGVSGTTAFGYETGLNTTSNSITAVGYQALKIDASLGNNTGVGYQALTANTTAYAGTAVGAYSLWANTTGTGNTAIGARSLFLNTTGTTNTAAGGSALENNSTGSYNAAVGGNALHNNTTGSRNVAMGNVAGQTNETGNRNTIVGSDADVATISTSDGVALGYRAVAVSKQLALSDSINQIKATGIPSGSGYVLTDVGGTGIFTAAPAGTAYFQNSLTGDTAFTNPSTDHFLFKSDVWGYGLLSANNSDTTKGAKVDTATLFPAIRATISSGGSQTPWLSTEDAARHSLINLKSLQIWVIDSTSGSVTYATLNPSDKGTDASLSGSNLIIQNTGAANASSRATVSKSSGKWYWETKLTNKNDNTVGFGDGTMNVNDIVGNDVHGWSLYTNTSGYIIHNGGFTGLSTSFANNDVIGFALDLGAGTCDIYQNNVFLYQITGITGTIFPAAGQATTVGIVTCNFGATTLAYTPPAGYNAGVYSTSGSVTYDTTTVFQTDSLTKRVGINQIPDAVFKLAVGGAVKFNDDSLYTPNLPILPLDSTNYKLEVVKTSDGKHVRMNWPTAAATVPLSGITAMTGNATINNAANNLEWQWNTLVTTGLKLSTNSTTASGGQILAWLDASGVNANSNQTTYGLYLSNSHSGTTSTTYGIKSQASGGTTNIAGYFITSGGTNNYALIVPSGGGSVGIGTSTPAYKFDVQENLTGVFAANITNNSSTGAGVGINTFSSSTETLFQLLSGALGSTSRLRMNANGHLQIGAGISPSALLQLDPGTATAGTAPLKFTSGTVMSTPEAGALEYNSGLLMLDSSNSQRDTIATRKWARNNISGGGTSSQWTTLSSDIYYNTGNVGIGSASAPTDKLHLRGASSNGLTVEGSQPMITLNATSNDPQITLTRAGNSSNMYVNSSTQLIVQGYNEVKVQQSGTTGFGIFSYVGGSFNSAFSIGSISNPTSTLQSYGSFATAYVAKTGTYSATDYDHTIDCTSGTFTVTLPTASGITGREYTIKNTGAGVITVGTTSGQFIDGTPNTSYTLPVLNKYVTVKSTNAGWIVIANN